MIKREACFGFTYQSISAAATNIKMKKCQIPAARHSTNSRRRYSTEQLRRLVLFTFQLAYMAL
jgi:hypothetical protein